MTPQDRATWLNTIVGIIGTITGVVGIAQALGFSFPKVRWDIFLISMVIFLVAIVIKRFKLRHIVPPKPPEIIEPPNTPIPNFTAQLGNPKLPGLLNKAQRLAQIQVGHNPYVCGASLSGNSAVFYGRQSELYDTLAVLRNPTKPGNVSILGERRIGKSSLLNQIRQALAAEANVVTIHTTMQNWSVDSQAAFFSQLHQTIAAALSVQSSPVTDYAGFREFIRHYANQYRFVLMIDEFDKMTENAYFDAEFFGHMRALGEQADYRWGYVLASYASLYDICHHGGIKESKFWNIFGTRYILGLLTPKEAEQLIQEPMQRALGRTFKGMKEILRYAGCHPAFIQLVATTYWNALHQGYAVNTDAIKSTLREHYQDLWQHRSAEERTLLLQIANHQTPEDSLTLMNLRQRGLVDSNNQLFAHFLRA